MMRLFHILGYAPAILVPRAVSLLVVIVFTRALEPSEFGLYSLIIVYGGLLDAVFLNWSRIGLLRFYHLKQGRALAALLPGSLAVMAAGICAGGLGAIILSAGSQSTWTLSFFLMLMVYFVSNGFLSFGLNILRAREQRTAYVLIETFRPVSGFIMAYLLVGAWGPDHIRLCIGMFSVSSVFGIPLVFSVVRSTGRSRPDWVMFQEMMRYSAPLLLVFALAQIITASDRFLLNALSGPASVGIYAASYSLARPGIDILFNVINIGEFPKLVKAFETGGSECARDVIKKTVTYLMFLCIPALIGIGLLAEPLSRLLVGHEYREGASMVIRLVALGGFLAGLKSFVFDQIFHLYRKSMVQSLTLVPGALVSIGLNLALIPHYGATGAAWAGCSGYGLSAFLSFIYSRRYMKIDWPVKKIAWVLVATLFMGLVIYGVQRGSEPDRMIFSIPSAGLIYYMICLRGKVLDFKGQASFSRSKEQSSS